MSPPLKLIHKGLILIAVPLAFELTFVFLLTDMLNRAQDETRRQTESKEVVALSSHLSNSLFQAGYALLSWRTLKSSFFIQQYDESISEVPKLIQQLDTLSAKNIERQKHVEVLKKISQRITYLTSNFRRPSDSAGIMLLNARAYITDLETYYRSYMDEVKKLTEDETRLQEKESGAAELSGKKLQWLIGISILINIAITIVWSVFFTKGITGRLQVLMNNADRLAKGDELNPVVSGRDEITQLDTVMHKVIANLRKAEQRKQEFMSMISHDLRSPLTALQANLSMIGKEQSTSQENSQRIARSKRSIARMIELIAQLLDIEKMEAGMLKISKEPINLATPINAAVETVGDLAKEKHLTIDVQLPETSVNCDAQRITQVVGNLLSNAIKFTPDGGTIAVCAEDESNVVKVSVKNTGTQISPEGLAKIFDRFYQLPTDDVRPSDGTGLGLPICKALVEAHGGTIGAQSSATEGTTFWFTLPKS